jgi:hypothetical protein
VKLERHDRKYCDPFKNIVVEFVRKGLKKSMKYLSEYVVA